jgi:hypothetical protein
MPPCAAGCGAHCRPVPGRSGPAPGPDLSPHRGACPSVALARASRGDTSITRSARGVGAMQGGERHSSGGLERPPHPAAPASSGPRIQRPASGGRPRGAVWVRAACARRLRA